MLCLLLPVIVQIKLLTNGLCLGGERPAVWQAHRHPSIIYMKFQSSLPGTRSSEQPEFSFLFFPYKPHLFILFSTNKKFALNYHCRSKEKERKKEDSDLTRPHQQCWSFYRVKIKFLSYRILSHIQSQPATFFMNANFRRWHTIVKKLFHRVTAGLLQRITRCGNMMEDTKII